LRLTDTPLQRAAWIGTLVCGSALFCYLLVPKVDYLPVAPTDNLQAPFQVAAGSNIRTIRDELGKTIVGRLKRTCTTASSRSEVLQPVHGRLRQQPSDGLPEESGRRRGNAEDPARRILSGLPDTQAFVSRGSLPLGRRRQRPQHLAGLAGLDIAGPARRCQGGAAGHHRCNTRHLSAADTAAVAGRAGAAAEAGGMAISRAGLDRYSVSAALRALTGGLYIGEYFDGNERMDMILRGPRWRSPEELSELPLVTPAAGVQTVGESGRAEADGGATTLLRLNGAAAPWTSPSSRRKT